MKQPYKTALIQEILASRNNVYSEDVLFKLKTIYLESILTDLILAGGKPIDKMTDQQLEDAEEIDFD